MAGSSVAGTLDKQPTCVAFDANLRNGKTAQRLSHVLLEPLA